MVEATLPLIGEWSLQHESSCSGSPGPVQSRGFEREDEHAEPSGVPSGCVSGAVVSGRCTVWFFPAASAMLPVMVVLAHHRAADDFKTIRARLEELRRERTGAMRGEPIASHRPSSPAPSPPRADADPGFVDASMD